MNFRVFFLLGLRLRPSYAENFYHVLPKSNTASAHKVLLLAGDAAISHHFWPGRGLNTGLKSVAAIVKMWRMNVVKMWRMNDPFCRLGSIVLVLSFFLDCSSKSYKSKLLRTRIADLYFVF